MFTEDQEAWTAVLDLVAQDDAFAGEFRCQFEKGGGWDMGAIADWVEPPTIIAAYQAVHRRNCRCFRDIVSKVGWPARSRPSWIPLGRQTRFTGAPRTRGSRATRCARRTTTLRSPLPLANGSYRDPQHGLRGGPPRKLWPAKPAHSSQVSRGQAHFSHQVGDDGFQLVEVTT
jgi:hypothetical protein